MVYDSKALVCSMLYAPCSMKRIIVYTDGGSRGNPGRAAVGVVFCDETGAITDKFGHYLGDGLTNNEAEYRAVVMAFEKLRKTMSPENMAQAEVEIRSDSQLLVNQMSGRFKIKNENIRNFVVTIHRLAEGFGKVFYTAIPREKNTEADRLVNEALEKQM